MKRLEINCFEFCRNGVTLWKKRSYWNVQNENREKLKQSYMSNYPNQRYNKKVKGIPVYLYHRQKLETNLFFQWNLSGKMEENLPQFFLSFQSSDFLWIIKIYRLKNVYSFYTNLLASNIFKCKAFIFKTKSILKQFDFILVKQVRIFYCLIEKLLIIFCEQI